MLARETEGLENAVASKLRTKKRISDLNCEEERSMTDVIQKREDESKFLQEIKENRRENEKKLFYFCHASFDLLPSLHRRGPLAPEPDGPPSSISPSSSSCSIALASSSVRVRFDERRRRDCLPSSPSLELGPLENILAVRAVPGRGTRG